jgi:thioredoxin 1
MMKKIRNIKYMIRTELLFSFLFGMLLLSCENSNVPPNINNIDSTVKVTFIEIGSDKCVDCIEMRPVMDSIQTKYGTQVLVKFIDAIKNYSEAVKYKITIMPTQVFLDSLGVEFHRHEGFYSEDSIHILLQSRGLKIINY